MKIKRKFKILVVVESEHNIPEQFRLYHEEMSENVVNAKLTRDYGWVETNEMIVEVVKKSIASRGKRCHQLVYLANKDEIYLECYSHIVRPFIRNF